MNRFIVAEPQSCIGCRTCEVACAMAHPLDQGAEALTAQNFRPRLTVMKSAKVSTPVLCRQCDDAPCLNACPNGAIVYSQDSVQVLQDRCVGCKTCMLACPFGVMQVVSVPLAKTELGLIGRKTRAQALKCDLCVDRSEGPACVASCPTKALHLIDRQALESSAEARRKQAALDTPLMPF